MVTQNQYSHQHHSEPGMSLDYLSKFLWIFYILSLAILDTSTKSSSTHWKLVIDERSGRNLIRPSSGNGDEDPLLQQSLSLSPSESSESSSSSEFNSSFPIYPHHWAAHEAEDLVLQILTTTVLSPIGSWTKTGTESGFCGVCGPKEIVDSGDEPNTSPNHLHSSSTSPSDSSSSAADILDCGRPANFTYYDQLIGVANRASHPHVPEPSVALLFKKKNSKKDTIDLNTLERKLKKAKEEKPSSVQLYNQIGNFWRIKGHTLRAIECFRRALAVAPNNPEVLHNLARLLLTLQYLDDALFLARRSLELQAPDRSAWQQHFTLGEILKAYGHHQEALLHFKHTLELRPDHIGALESLRELESLLSGTGLHICTLLIIIFLVLGVLIVMLSSLEAEEVGGSGDYGPGSGSRPPPRHFSRALAMRSLKLGISPRALRAKRFS